MNFCKASLLSLLTVSSLSIANTLAVAEATSSQDGFSSEVIKSFISLFSSSPPSKTLASSSCYKFRMEIETDESPEGISWEVKNANTGEILASQEEGFYTDAETLYSHDETICLDMDNIDICYNVVVNDTDTNYPSATLKLFHNDEDHNDDLYYIWTFANETDTVCGFDDFRYYYGCLLTDPEPSCACGDIAYCAFQLLSYGVFAVVCSPCIAFNFIFGYAFALFYLYYCIGLGRTPL